MVRPLLWLIGNEPTPEIVYECRRCGTSVEQTESVCPYCGLSEIAVYDLR